MTRKRTVKLPSGRSIEVTYHDREPVAAKPPVRDLTVCPHCDSDTVYPVEWDEAAEPMWEVTLRCGSCERVETGMFDQLTVDAFDKRLDAFTEVLVGDLFRLTKANMRCEADRFAEALARDLIVPEDF